MKIAELDNHSSLIKKKLVRPLLPFNCYCFLAKLFINEICISEVLKTGKIVVKIKSGKNV